MLWDTLDICVRRTLSSSLILTNTILFSLTGLYVMLSSGCSPYTASRRSGRTHLLWLLTAAEHFYDHHKPYDPTRNMISNNILWHLQRHQSISFITPDTSYHNYYHSGSTPGLTSSTSDAITGIMTFLFFWQDTENMADLLRTLSPLTHFFESIISNHENSDISLYKNNILCHHAWCSRTAKPHCFTMLSLCRVPPPHTWIYPFTIIINHFRLSYRRHCQHSTSRTFTSETSDPWMSAGNMVYMRPFLHGSSVVHSSPITRTRISSAFRSNINTSTSLSFHILVQLEYS
jgi:hypothetical protein